MTNYFLFLDSEVVGSRQRIRQMVKQAADKHENSYRFEEADPLNESSASLGSTLDGATSHTLEGAVVTFGSAMHQTLIGQQISAKDRQQLLDHCCRSLSCAWGLLVSSDVWSYELENVCTAVTTSIVKLMNFLLVPESSERGQFLDRLATTVRYFSAQVKMVSFDSFTHHLMPACVKWLYNVTTLLLTQSDLKMSQRLHLAATAFNLVKFAENITNT